MNNLAPQNIFECINLEITDALLSNAKIAAYLFNIVAKNSVEKTKPFTPKSFPERAIDIIIPVENLLLEVFFNPKNLCWDSRFIYDGKYGKLSIEQFDQFFNTAFYKNLVEKIKNKWPLSDPYYKELFDNAIKMNVVQHMSDDDLGNLNEVDDQTEVRKDKANQDTTGDGKRDYSGSGRKIITFSDMGVTSKGAEYYCWPRRGKEYKWNSWKDWKKIKPFCKMTFKHNHRRYMISLSLFDENFENRGFRGADIDWNPPFAWLTPEECSQVMELSIVKKFLRQCLKKAKSFVDQDPNDIYEKIDKKDRVTVKEIEKTIKVIKHCLKTAFRDGQADTYKY